MEGERRSPKVRKTGSPKEAKAERGKAKGIAKPEVSSPKMRVKNQESRIKTSEVKVERLKEKGGNKLESILTAERLAPTPKKELPTDNSKLQTEEMEVHHHPNLHHEKKAWKEYVLEGLMIFLAVTMGFFAETIREGISDRSKGHEYIRSFVEDLRRDTADFARLVAFDEKRMRILNNLSPCFDVIEKDHSSTSCLLPILKNSLYSKGINFADGTLQQLKNAGGFRLLKLADKDSIIAYDHSIKAYENYQSTAFQESQDNVRNTYAVTANFKAEAIFPDSVKSNDKIPIFYSDDKALVNKLFNDLEFYQKATMQQIKLTKNLKRQATVLIKYFDNKYDLE